jgi:hypothetical protein
MLTTIPRSWIIGAWSATLAIIVGSSAVVGASFSTSAILLVLGVTPVVIMTLLRGARTPTVAEILHAAETKNGPR